MIILTNLVSSECFWVCSIDFRAQNWIWKHSKADFCENPIDYGISLTKSAIFSCFLRTGRVWLKKCASATSKVISEARNRKKHIKTILKWKLLFLNNTNRKINDFLQKWFFIIFCKKSVLEFLDFYYHFQRKIQAEKIEKFNVAKNRVFWDGSVCWGRGAPSHPGSKIWKNQVVFNFHYTLTTCWGVQKLQLSSSFKTKKHL